VLDVRDVHYWSIFGVERGHPEIIALFVGGFYERHEKSLLAMRE